MQPQIKGKSCCGRSLLLYTIRSDGHYWGNSTTTLLFRWFVDFSLQDEIWNHSRFAKILDCLLKGDIARLFLKEDDQGKCGLKRAARRDPTRRLRMGGHQFMSTR
ncbi:MAG: hypothetical protein ACYYK0_06910 [Candidatus Eutrophobiaceae bacterium]